MTDPTPDLDPKEPRAALAGWLRARPECLRAAWLGRAGGAWGVLWVESGAGGAGEPASLDGFPWPVLCAAQGAICRRWGPRELRAWPALLARGVREALLRVGASDERALWLEARAPGVLTEPDASALADHLLDGERRRLQVVHRLRLLELEARAKLALANRHDLRNELSLAQLELERAALEPAVGLDGLRRALEGARRLSQAPLEPRSASSVEGPPVGGVRLEPLLREELRASARLAGRGSDVRLELRCARGLRWVGSASDLGRWVRNAVLNALRVSNSGGAVRVVVEPRRQGLLVSVLDEGPGMDEMAAHELFEPGRSGTGGSGFGSAALEACARALDAAFELETEPGVGTRLSLELPWGAGPDRTAGESGPRSELDPPAHARSEGTARNPTLR